MGDVIQLHPERRKRKRGKAQGHLYSVTIPISIVVGGANQREALFQVETELSARLEGLTYGADSAIIEKLDDLEA